jgi:hypothetical protein
MELIRCFHDLLIQQCIQLEYLDRSSIPEHSIDQGHRIPFHSAFIIIMKTRYIDCIVSEATKIELYPYNINREGGFSLSKSWKPLIGSLETFEMTQVHLVTQSTHYPKLLLCLL